MRIWIGYKILSLILLFLFVVILWFWVSSIYRLTIKSLFIFQSVFVRYRPLRSVLVCFCSFWSVCGNFYWSYFKEIYKCELMVIFFGYFADCIPKRYVIMTEFFCCKKCKNKKMHVQFITHFFLIKKPFFSFLY